MVEAPLVAETVEAEMATAAMTKAAAEGMKAAVLTAGATVEVATVLVVEAKAAVEEAMATAGAAARWVARGVPAPSHADGNQSLPPPPRTGHYDTAPPQRIVRTSREQA